MQQSVALTVAAVALAVLMAVLCADALLGTSQCRTTSADYHYNTFTCAAVLQTLLSPVALYVYSQQTHVTDAVRIMY
jgi:hypothetical protein